MDRQHGPRPTLANHFVFLKGVVEPNAVVEKKWNDGYDTWLPSIASGYI